MDKANIRNSRTGAVALGALVGAIIDPVTRRRGFATAELIAAWPEIIGARWAACTAPEKIVWPRGEDGGLAVLTLRVDGPEAIFVQHEATQILERVNAFLGYGAVGKLRLVQAPMVQARPPATAEKQPLSAAEAAALDARVAGVDAAPLRAALQRLGREVIGERHR